MSLIVGFACASVGLSVAGLSALLCPPRTRLSDRVRPYVSAASGRSAQPFRAIRWSEGLRRIGFVLDRTSDAALQLRLRRAGLVTLQPDEYRVRVAGQAVLFAIAGGMVGVTVIRSAVMTIVLGVCGAVFGASRWRGRVDRSIERRRDRIRLELYTVNQLLAITLRTGAGPIQAVQRVVDRAVGVVADELGNALVWIRSGMAEGDAFRRLAELTPEPAAARTYKLFAIGTELGVDLGSALRDLSEDLRDARREELRRNAVRRRASMLVPTIAVLAPVMLLFIAAPIPSMLFGRR